MKYLCPLVLAVLVLSVPALAAADTAAAPVLAVTTQQPDPSLLVHRAVTAPPIITPPGTITLTISSIPEGAAVHVDGVDTGKVTKESIRISSGTTHTVRLTLGGYRDYIINVPNLSADTPPVTIIAMLEPVRAIPVNETPRTRTAAWSVETRAEPGQDTLLQAVPGSISSVTPGPLNQSIPAFVNLTFTSLPSGAAIRVNGTDTGMVTPGTITLNRSRIYQVNLTLTGYKENSRIVNLSQVTIPVTIFAMLEPVRTSDVNYTPRAIPASRGALITPAVPDSDHPPDTSPTLQGTRVPAIRKEEGLVDSFIGFFSGILTRPDCPPSLRACAKQCVDLQTDAANCGLCGYTCPAGAVCSSGECRIYGSS